MYTSDQVMAKKHYYIVIFYVLTLFVVPCKKKLKYKKGDFKLQLLSLIEPFLIHISIIRDIVSLQECADVEYTKHCFIQFSNIHDSYCKLVHKKCY